MKIEVIGIDMAFANMGVALATLDLGTEEIDVHTLVLVETKKEQGKQVRVSSDKFARAQELHKALVRLSTGPRLAFAEIPTGSQSAAAASALGIAVGVLASCVAPVVEVTPMEVKNLFATKKTVPKSQIIAWAVKEWPDAQWLRHKSKGKMVLTNSNEHLADAVATIKAGLATQNFKILRAMMQNEIPNPDNNRPPSGGQRQRSLPVGPVPVASGAGNRKRRRVHIDPR